MYEIEIPNKIHDEIINIVDYIFRFSFSKELSLKIANELYSQIYSLKIFPSRCPLFHKNYRIMVIKSNYKVFYEINENKKLVIIYKVLSSRQNDDDLF